MRLAPRAPRQARPPSRGLHAASLGHVRRALDVPLSTPPDSARARRPPVAAAAIRAVRTLNDDQLRSPRPCSGARARARASRRARGSRRSARARAGVVRVAERRGLVEVGAASRAAWPSVRVWRARAPRRRRRARPRARARHAGGGGGGGGRRARSAREHEADDEGFGFEVRRSVHMYIDRKLASAADRRDRAAARYRGSLAAAVAGLATRARGARARAAAPPRG